MNAHSHVAVRIGYKLCRPTPLRVMQPTCGVLGVQAFLDIRAVNGN
jgi:hypothetical protein